jgi:phage portal protein BeeE
MVLEGGLDWKTMSLSPKDMDFMEAKHSAAREIALAFGVPPMLLAIANEAAPINAWRSPREPLDAFATFEGFEN